jgi:hypothetical protein
MDINIMKIGTSIPVQFMSFSEAMEIVSQFGYSNGSASLLDAISDMEDAYDDLSLNQIAAYNIVIGEYDNMADHAMV